MQNLPLAGDCMLYFTGSRGRTQTLYHYGTSYKMPERRPTDLIFRNPVSLILTIEFFLAKSGRKPRNNLGRRILPAATSDSPLFITSPTMSRFRSTISWSTCQVLQTPSFLGVHLPEPSHIVGATAPTISVPLCLITTCSTSVRMLPVS